MSSDETAAPSVFDVPTEAVDALAAVLVDVPRWRLRAALATALPVLRGAAADEIVTKFPAAHAWRTGEAFDALQWAADVLRGVRVSSDETA